MIPDGVHYVYCASKGPYNDLAPRVGFLHYFKRGEILIREWSHEEEELKVRVKGDPELEKRRIRENIQHLDRFLAPYNYEELRKWVSLTNYLNENTIERLSPLGEMIRNTAEFLSCPDSERPRGKPSSSIRTIKIKSVEDESKYLPDLKLINGTMPNYTKIPERYTKDTPAAEITFNNVDTINLVEQVLSQFNNDNLFLEEIQYSFILYLCGLSIDSLSHWRKILSILCNSDRAIAKYKNFYKKFVNIVKFQIVEIPVEFIEQNSDNSIYVDVKNLLVNLMVNNQVEVANDLKSHLHNEIKWSFPNLLDEDEDDLPVVVDLGEIGGIE
jgi:A1 cistron-splicing factor AAR2